MESRVFEGFMYDDVDKLELLVRELQVVLPTAAVCHMAGLQWFLCDPSSWPERLQCVVAIIRDKWLVVVQRAVLPRTSASLPTLGTNQMVPISCSKCGNFRSGAH